jgi:ribosomal 30S subunit maturation factor RimM
MRYNTLVCSGLGHVNVKWRQALTKHTVTALINNCSSRNIAETFIRKKLYVEKAAMQAAAKMAGAGAGEAGEGEEGEAEGEYYTWQLNNLEVIECGSEKRIGHVIAVEDYGAGAFITIQDGNKAIATLPFTNRAVPDIDLANAKMFINCDYIIWNKLK